jgi:hypothetical protein
MSENLPNFANDNNDPEEKSHATSCTVQSFCRAGAGRLFFSTALCGG